MKIKRALAFAIAICLLASISLLPATALEPPGPEVFFNGKAVSLTDALPMIDGDGTIYLPLRALADTMDAGIGWANEMVTFTYAGKTLSFNLKGVGTLASGGKTEAYTLKPAPKVVNGRTLIAGDTLADVYGLLVSYTFRQSRIHVSVIDLAPLTKDLDDRFSILNSMLDVYLGLNDSVQTGSMAGKLDLTLPILGILSPTFSVPFEFNFDTATKGLNSTGNYDFSVDLDGILPLLPLLGLDLEDLEDGEIAAIFPLLLNLLGDFSLSYILNSDDDIMYFLLPAMLNELLGIDDGTWLSIGLGLADADIDMDGLLDGLTFASMLELSLTDAYNIDYEDIVFAIALLEGLIGDKAFTKTGTDAEPVYTLETSLGDLIEGLAVILAIIGEDVTADELWEEIHSEFDELDFSLKLIYSPKKDGYRSEAEFTFIMEADGVSVEMSITAVENLPGKSTMKMAVKVSDGTNFSVSLTIDYEVTIEPFDGKLPAAPPEGSDIVDIEGIW